MAAFSRAWRRRSVRTVFAAVKQACRYNQPASTTSRGRLLALRPDRQTRFASRPGPNGGRHPPLEAPPKRPGRCAETPVRRRPARLPLPYIAAVIVRRPSSSLYLLEPAENEIRHYFSNPNL